jgi:hypothetical protein
MLSVQLPSCRDDDDLHFFKKFKSALITISIF